MAASFEKPVEDLTYEEAVSELESVVSSMEKGSLTLEESIEAYGRGVALARACRQRLAKAEEAIKRLDEEGRLVTVRDSELRADSVSRARPRKGYSGNDDEVPF